MGLLIVLFLQMQREPWECPAPRERGYICDAQKWCEANPEACR